LNDVNIIVVIEDRSMCKGIGLVPVLPFISTSAY